MSSVMCILAFTLFVQQAPEAPVQETGPDPFPPSAAEEQGLTTSDLDRLIELVANCVEGRRIVGAELLVIKNRRTVLHEALGWKDRDDRIPMVRNTIFNIRSMTKPLVGTAALMLKEDERFELSAPVADILDSFDHDDAADITVEHLLTHRSGLPDTHPAGSPSTYSGLRAVADYWGGHGPSEFAPGESFAYSDPGADVLGAVVAEVSGLPLEQYVTRNLLLKIGARDSFAMTDRFDPRDARIASDYKRSLLGWSRYWKPGDGPLMPFVCGSGTTWYATPRDYARFLALWMDEGRVGDEQLLSEETVRQALKPISEMPYTSGIEGLKVYYGQMWQVYVSDDEKREVTAFGHSGSDGTYAWAWPGEDLMILYFTQSRGQQTRLLLEAEFGALRE